MTERMTRPEAEITVSEEPVVLASVVLAAAFVALTAWISPRPVTEVEVGRFLLLLLAGVVAHEGLHVVGWMVAGRIPPRRFRFGVLSRYGTLYAHCDTSMPMGAYRVGCALPGVLTGIAPWAVGLLLADPALSLAGALLTAGAVGDAAVLWASRGVPREMRVQDHPTEVGLRLVPDEGVSVGWERGSAA